MTSIASANRHYVPLLVSLLACFLPVNLSTAVGGTIVWVGTQWWDNFEDTAQQFTSPGSPSVVLEYNFGTRGSYRNLAVVDDVMYSAPWNRGGSTIARWDAISGAPLGDLTLSSSLSTHFLDGSGLGSIGVTTDGELLFAPTGFSTQRRAIAKYTTTGTYLRTYTSAYLQHVHGSPAGNADAVFVASRYDVGDGWQEDVLMFSEAGWLIDIIDPGESVGDVAIMGSNLYVLVYGSGINVYALNGALLPTFTHTIALPASVNPSLQDSDGLYAFRGRLFVSDDSDDAVYEIDLNGNLVATYAAETQGTRSLIGAIAVFAVPEPAGLVLACCGVAGVLFVSRPRRRVAGTRRR